MYMTVHMYMNNICCNGKIWYSIAINLCTV